MGRDEWLARPEGGGRKVGKGFNDQVADMAGLKNVNWIEMVVEGTAEVSRFYADVVGLKREAFEEDEEHTSYSLKDDSGKEVLGVCDKGAFPTTPAGWVPYVDVVDFGDSVSKVESSGGIIIQEMTMDYNWKGQRFCLIGDPSGNRMMLCEMRREEEGDGTTNGRE